MIIALVIDACNVQLAIWAQRSKYYICTFGMQIPLWGQVATWGLVHELRSMSWTSRNLCWINHGIFCGFRRVCTLDNPTASLMTRIVHLSRWTVSGLKKFLNHNLMYIMLDHSFFSTIYTFGMYGCNLVATCIVFESLKQFLYTLSTITIIITPISIPINFTWLIITILWLELPWLCEFFHQCWRGMFAQGGRDAKNEFNPTSMANSVHDRARSIASGPDLHQGVSAKSANGLVSILQSQHQQ